MEAGYSINSDIIECYQLRKASVEVINYVGLPIVYSKDNPIFANDLSFMTEADWAHRRWHMELDKILRLTPDELNSRVMKLCGWALERWDGPNEPDYWAQFEDGHYRTDEKAEGLPNYPEDLNLMADAVEMAVRKLGMKFRISFDSALAQIIGHHDHIEDDMIHASALLRAQAFVVTVEQHQVDSVAELMAAIPKGLK